MNGEPDLSLFLLDGGLGRASPGDSALSREKSDTANARKYMFGPKARLGEPSEGDPTHLLLFLGKGDASGASPRQISSTERTFFKSIHPVVTLVNEILYVTRFWRRRHN